MSSYRTYRASRLRESALLLPVRLSSVRSILYLQASNAILTPHVHDLISVIEGEPHVVYRFYVLVVYFLLDDVILTVISILPHVEDVWIMPDALLIEPRHGILVARVGSSRNEDNIRTVREPIWVIL